MLLAAMNFCVAAHGKSMRTVSAKIGGLSEDHPITLLRFSGIDLLFVDSARTDVGGHVSFQIPESVPTGLFRMYLGTTLESIQVNRLPQLVDFIYSGTDVQMRSHFFYPLDSLRIQTGSDLENIQFLSYRKKNVQFQKNMNDLSSQLFSPESGGPMDPIQLAEFRQVQLRWCAYEDSLIAAYPNAWFTRIVKANKFSIVDPTMSNEERITYLKNNFFNDYIFSDPELLRTNIIEDRIIGYMQMYFGHGLADNEQDAQFIKAIDIVLKEASKGSPDVYAYVLNNLIVGFEMNGRIGVLDYLNAAYGESSCTNDLLSEASRKRLASSARNAVGMPAADIETNDLQGNPVKLSAISADITLVVFWAAWCDHCRELVPELRNAVSNNAIGLPDSTELTVIAVSLDDDEQQLRTFLSENDYSSWITISDFKKWNGAVVKDYNVYATPTIFVLDDEKKIIAKSASISELKNSLTRL